MPGPVSQTRISISPCCACWIEIVTLPCCVNFTALPIRLLSTHFAQLDAIRAKHQTIWRRIVFEAQVLLLGLRHELPALLIINQRRLPGNSLSTRSIPPESKREIRSSTSLTRSTSESASAGLEIAGDFGRFLGDRRVLAAALQKLGEKNDRVGGRADVVRDGG